MKTHLLLLSRAALLACVTATGPVLGEAILIDASQAGKNITATTKDVQFTPPPDIRISPTRYGLNPQGFFELSWTASSDVKGTGPASVLVKDGDDSFGVLTLIWNDAKKGDKITVLGTFRVETGKIPDGVLVADQGADGVSTITVIRNDPKKGNIAVPDGLSVKVKLRVADSGTTAWLMLLGVVALIGFRHAGTCRVDSQRSTLRC